MLLVLPQSSHIQHNLITFKDRLTIQHNQPIWNCHLPQRHKLLYYPISQHSLLQNKRHHPLYRPIYQPNRFTHMLHSPTYHLFIHKYHLSIHHPPIHKFCQLTQHLFIPQNLFIHHQQPFIHTFLHPINQLGPFTHIIHLLMHQLTLHHLQQKQ